MATETTVPGVGRVSRRQLAYGIGGALIVSAAGWWWWRRRTAATPAAAAADTTTADDTSLTDSGLGSGGGGGAGGGGTPGLSDPGIPGAFTSNAAWSAFVRDQLGVAFDPAALSTALGRYLAGETLTTDQHGMIDAARGVAGDPPVAGVGGYPPAIHEQSGGGTGQTTSGPGPATPPKLTLKATGPRSVTGTLPPVKGAHTYEWWTDGSPHGHTTTPTFTWTYLTRGRPYNLSVSVEVNGQWSQLSPPATITLK